MCFPARLMSKHGSSKQVDIYGSHNVSLRGTGWAYLLADFLFEDLAQCSSPGRGTTWILLSHPKGFPKPTEAIRVCPKPLLTSECSLEAKKWHGLWMKTGSDILCPFLWHFECQGSWEVYSTQWSELGFNLERGLCMIPTLAVPRIAWPTSDEYKERSQEDRMLKSIYLISFLTV